MLSASQRIAPALLTALAILVSGSAARAQGAGSTPFAAHARDYLKDLGMEQAEPAEVDLQEIFDAHYVRIDMGLFDVRYPRRSIEEQERFEDLVSVLVGLIDLQRVWVEWLEPVQDPPREVGKAVKALRKAVGSWKLPRNAGADGDLRLVEWMEPKDDLRQALATFNDYMRSKAVMGLPVAAEGQAGGQGGEGSQVVLCPTRADFIRFASFAGANDKALTDILWNDSVLNWTEFWISYPRDIQVIAMEYPSHADPFRGVSMNAREPTGLLQHVLQQAGFSMSWSYFGRGIEPVFEVGLAQNLVIATVGENNARSGGSGKANTTSARSVFVPGGLSSGGVLPAQNADSRWRSELGSDHFTKALHAAQSAGEDYAEEKALRPAHFEIVSEDGGDRLGVEAPFLGTPGQAQKPAAQEFTADYLEFFRAYKSGFVNWMRERAGGRKDSAKRWGELLVALASSEGEANLERLCEEIYGQPLSGSGPEPETLEWGYLQWLAKQ